MRNKWVTGQLALLVASGFYGSTALAAKNDPPATFLIEAWGGSSTKGVLAERKNGRLHNVVTKNNEVSILNQLLQGKYGSGVRVVNKGAPSAQAIELLNGRYKYDRNPPWQQVMKTSRANMILLNFATNDARHYHFKDIEKDYIVSPQRYTEVMMSLINSAKANGKEVILQEPHPLCGGAEKWDVAPYSAQLDGIARKANVPLVDQYQRIRAMPDWKNMMSPDCIHPSETLYRVKALETFKVIEKNYGAQLAALKKTDS